MVRYKNRYFTVEVVPQENHSSALEPFQLKDNEFYQAVLDVTEEIHGEYGSSVVQNGLNVKYCNEYTRIAIIRSRHGPHRLLGSSLPFLSKIGKRSVQIQGIYTGATMVKCFKFIQKKHEEKLVEILKVCKSETERQQMIKNISTINYNSQLAELTNKIFM